jgi:hypothetical protein
MRFSADVFRRVVALLAIAAGVLWIAYAGWVWLSATAPARGILVQSGIMAAVLIFLAMAGISSIAAGVMLLRNKKK